MRAAQTFLGRSLNGQPQLSVDLSLPGSPAIIADVQEDKMPFRWGRGSTIKSMQGKEPFRKEPFRWGKGIKAGKGGAGDSGQGH